MEAVIDNIKHGDILEIKKLLKESTAIISENPSREILNHINSGAALKMVADGKIIGIWCSLDMGEYTSLSYFYVVPRIRCTLLVLKLFKAGLNIVDMNKPLLIETKDTAGFSRYVEHIENNVYSFKGFR